MKLHHTSLVHYINRYNQGKELIDKGIAKTDYEIGLCTDQMNRAQENIIRIVTSDQFKNIAENNREIMELE